MTFNRPNRPLIKAEDVYELERQGTLAAYDRLERTRFFDGKFLTARDLIREQEYFLHRQANLGRAMGPGVIEGLLVEVNGIARHQIRILPGHGLTPLGEMVVLPNT